MSTLSSRRIRFSPYTVNVVTDGNSLTAGYAGPWESAVPYPAQLATLFPLAQGGVVVYNRGISGQTTQEMANQAADVDGLWQPSMTNVLLVWETTNNVARGRTGAQSLVDMVDYISGRQALAAANPWHVILMTTLPRQVSGGPDAQQAAFNAELDYFDTQAKSNYLDMGAHQIIDVRQPGSPFSIPNYTNAAFETLAANGYWATGEAGSHVHLNTPGYGIIAGWSADALQRARLR